MSSYHNYLGTIPIYLNVINSNKLALDKKKSLICLGYYFYCYNLRYYILNCLEKTYMKNKASVGNRSSLERGVGKPSISVIEKSIENIVLLSEDYMSLSSKK